MQITGKIIYSFYMKKYHTGLAKFILEIAPDFCWLTTYDLLLMVEQDPEFEEVDEASFKVIVCGLIKSGKLKRRKGYYRVNSERGSVPDLIIRASSPL